MVPGRGEIIVIPIRRTPTGKGSSEYEERTRRITELRAELQCVKRAIRALEKLAASRVPGQRYRAPKTRAASLSCGSGPG